MSCFCSEELGFYEKKLRKKKDTSATIGKLVCSSGKYHEDFVEDTYKLIVDKMMKSYFNPDENTDYFRKSFEIFICRSDRISIFEHNNMHKTIQSLPAS